MVGTKPKIYSKSFLTKPRFVTLSEEKAIKSLFMWKKHHELYTLSFLGIINGFLLKTNRIVFLEIQNDLIVKTTIEKIEIAEEK